MMFFGRYLAGACLAAIAGPAFSDAQAGRELARGCQVCHGLDGAGTNPSIPNIGGQSEMYLVKQLQDFRAGRRDDPQMTIIAEPLTNEEIRSLAAWYASITATYEMPPAP